MNEHIAKKISCTQCGALTRAIAGPCSLVHCKQITDQVAITTQCDNGHWETRVCSYGIESLDEAEVVAVSKLY